MRPALIYRRLLGGALEAGLAALLATLSVIVGLSLGLPGAMAVDLAACAAAALTVRWPRLAGIALGAILAGYAAAPPHWPETGAYAALIPVLGTGVRGERRQQWAFTVAYWVILTARQLVGYPAGDFRGLLSGIVWAVLFAGAWLIAGAIAAYRRAEEQSRIAALAQQRLSLARDLHDTLARTLARLSLRAYNAAATNDSTQLRALADQANRAAGELRWLLGALRDPESGDTLTAGGSLATAVRESVSALEAAGSQVAVAIDGDLDSIPAETSGVLAEILKEAAANVERHGAPGRPCTLVASIDELSADVALINEVREGSAPESPSSAGLRPHAGLSLGLVGAAERLAVVGGQLDARQEGTQWITRVSVPIFPEEVVSRVMIVDDDPLVRAMLTACLNAAPDLSVVGAYESGEAALEALPEARPDVAVVDIVMPVLDGPETTRRIRAASPATQVLALTSLTEPRSAAAMLHAGALGFLPKDLPPEAIVRAVQTARHGIAVLGGAAGGLIERREQADAAALLSPTERQILLLIRQGRTTEQIAREVFLSTSTVKYHVAALMTKLGATNRVTLALRAVELGLR